MYIYMICKTLKKGRELLHDWAESKGKGKSWGIEFLACKEKRKKKGVQNISFPFCFCNQMHEP